MKKFVFVAAMVLLVSMTVLASPVVYNNGGPNQQNGNEMSLWLQAENFSLGTATVLTDAHFWSIEGNGAYQGTIQWYIMSDAGGMPGAILASGTVAPTRTVTGNCWVGGCGLFEAAYDFLLPSVGLGAGNYFLALHNGSSYCCRDEMYWETTAPTYGDGRESYQGTFGNWASNGQEHAFYLTGQGGGRVPEPGTMVLLGSGLLAIAHKLKKTA